MLKYKIPQIVTLIHFFHVNNVVTDVREGNIVTFDLERGAKGMNAVNICLER